MVENVSTQESVKNLDTKELMSSTSTRKKLIENLMKEADTYGFDGFNLDFESLKKEAGPQLCTVYPGAVCSLPEQGIGFVRG